MKRRTLIQYAAAVAGGTIIPATHAQQRIIRIVVPYSAGGPTDVMVRVIAPSMAKTLDRTVLVENKPGGSTLIGSRAVLNAPNDGSITVMVQNIGFLGLPYLQKNVGFNPIKDFTPVAMLSDGPAFIYVHSSVPARTMAEFIAWAKTVPGGVESATSGPGGGSHTWTLLLANRAGINLVPVPYKGGSDMTTALIRGDAKVYISNGSEILNGQVRAGKLRILGVTSDRPSALAPGIPIVADTVPGFVISGWFGFFGPGNMAAADVQAVSNAARIALEEPGTKEKYATFFNEIRFEGAQEFTHSVQKTDEFWRKVVSDLNIKPE